MVLRSVLFGMWLIALYSGPGLGATDTWREHARNDGLSEADVTQLGENRLLVTNETYRQVFEAYSSPTHPPFITPDSLLNAYHVLYEESILHLETTRALQLPEILRIIVNNIEFSDNHLIGKPALVTSARRRAMLVTGIAMGLLDNSFRFKDETLNTIIEREIQRVLAATGRGTPQWLGPFDGSFMELDYTRYKPRGFYTRTETLKRYFRAVSWLQSIPFRLSRDEEFLAILMLGNTIVPERLKNCDMEEKIRTFFTAYNSFIGIHDDWDLTTAMQEGGKKLVLNLDSDNLNKRRRRLQERAKLQSEPPLINDQIQLPPNDPKEMADLTFRILSAYRTPDGILFGRTTDIRQFESRHYPTGLEVAVALGSTFAREHLDDPYRTQVLDVIDSCEPQFSGHSLYFEYLHVLQSLLDDPEFDAPDFMRNTVWQAKSCNTALAGWAQLRHTWMQQAKLTTSSASVRRTPAGFVEPDPEFFSRMADLAGKTRNLLRQSGAFDQKYAVAIETFTVLGDFLADIETVEDFNEKFNALRGEEADRVRLARIFMSMLEPRVHDPAVLLQEGLGLIDGVLEDLKQGRPCKNPKLEDYILQFEFNLDAEWERLAMASLRLERIAHKQLRGADLNDSETQFIKDYDVLLTYLMLSSLGGDDDAPRVADVFFNPNTDRHFHVGIARPRKLYVLYPWHGQTILCQGAVLPYYEFTSSERLTDGSWRQMLDSQDRPSVPDWMNPLVSGRDLNRAEVGRNRSR